MAEMPVIRVHISTWRARLVLRLTHDVWVVGRRFGRDCHGLCAWLLRFATYRIRIGKGLWEKRASPFFITDHRVLRDSDCA